MTVTVPVGPGAKRSWPEHVGTCGRSPAAARAQSADRSPYRALAALAVWTDALESGLATEEGFPFREILAYYQAVGRKHVAAELVAALRRTHRRLDRAPWRPRLLNAWLPSGFDQQDGDYHSYMCGSLLEGLGGPEGASEPADADADRVIDALLVTLIADLARVEREAAESGCQGREQRRRSEAAMLALRRSPDLAPRRPPGLYDPGAGDDPQDPGAVLGRTPAPVRRVVELAMLPTTPLHDEYMFIRSVQIFETLYRQVIRCLDRARAALGAGDATGAHAELSQAASRLEAVPALYRVLTTMPRDTFAIIREYTRGRSAIQSRTYRRVELTCAPATPRPGDEFMPDIRVEGLSLQELFMAAGGRAATADLERVRDAMMRVDTAWRSMKRTHWGVALKIIGAVMGTGGTQGADYLKVAADLPLFPSLQRPR